MACVENLAGFAGHVNYDAIPGVIYTHPEVTNNMNNHHLNLFQFQKDLYIYKNIYIYIFCLSIPQSFIHRLQVLARQRKN